VEVLKKNLSKKIMPPTPLYGGSLAIDLPSTYFDVSGIRQIPDHQEVYVDRGAGSDWSMVCEIVEHQGSVQGSEAGAYFWQDLCDANECLETRGWRELSPASALAPFLPRQFREPKVEPRCDQVVVCCGWQKIPPPPSGGGGGGGSGGGSDASGGRVEPHLVFICLAILRLPGVASEVLVTLNAPGKEEGYADPEHEDRALAAFQCMVSSLEIHDFSLFGN
jgi:hypothetical protein